MPVVLGSAELEQSWNRLRSIRTRTTEEIEPLRREKIIGSSLEAVVSVQTDDAGMAGWFDKLSKDDLAEVLIVSQISGLDFTTNNLDDPITVSATKTTNHKCGRCWRHLPEVAEDGALCDRCEDVVNG